MIWERSWMIYLFIFLSDLCENKILVSSAKWRIIEWEIASFRMLIYIRNSKGPSTDPCGTPWVTSILSETVSLTIVCWILFVRYDSNQLSVTPLMPQWHSLSIKILWLIVSKAFWKSRKTPQENVFLSSASVILISAWLVECAFLNPNCLGGVRGVR